jgi:hypothetical protein
VLIALFADLTAMPISADRAAPSALPTKPNLRDMILVSTVLGVFLVAQTMLL